MENIIVYFLLLRLSLSLFCEHMGLSLFYHKSLLNSLIFSFALPYKKTTTRKISLSELQDVHRRTKFSLSLSFSYR